METFAVCKKKLSKEKPVELKVGLDEERGDDYGTKLRKLSIRKFGEEKRERSPFDQRSKQPIGQAWEVFHISRVEAHHT